MRSPGVSLIEAERRRQVQEEGWSSEHDDEHVDGELSGAAVSYTRTASHQIAGGPAYYLAEAIKPPSQEWRWEAAWWKPSEKPLRNLVKAGALIAAEIYRPAEASA